MTEFAICFENIIKHQLSAKSSTRHACFIQVKFQFFVVFCVENCLYKTMTVQHFRDLLVLAGAHTHCLSYLWCNIVLFIANHTMQSLSLYSFKKYRLMKLMIRHKNVIQNSELHIIHVAHRQIEEGLLLSLQ